MQVTAVLHTMLAAMSTGPVGFSDALGQVWRLRLQFTALDPGGVSICNGLTPILDTALLAAANR